VFVNGRSGETTEELTGTGGITDWLSGGTMGVDTFVGNTVWFGNPDAAPEALDDEF